jgi:hypothetical protein
MEAIRSSETSVHTRYTRRHIPEDGMLHSHRRENLKSYIIFFINSLVSEFWVVSHFSAIWIVNEIATSADGQLQVIIFVILFLYWKSLAMKAYDRNLLNYIEFGKRYCSLNTSEFFWLLLVPKQDIAEFSLPFICWKYSTWSWSRTRYAPNFVKTILIIFGLFHLSRQTVAVQYENIFNAHQNHTLTSTLETFIFSI